ncbi:MAG: hypothetical protein LUG54_07410 [Clostridiales bacterium]|nr:hypothetical protein [Clostridiales bacterium]
MNQMSFEWKKLFRQRGFIIILVICAAMNLMLLVNSIAGRNLTYTAEAYREMMADISGLSANEACEQLSEAIHCLYPYYYGIEEMESDSLIDEIYPYTGDIWSEWELLSDELTELEKVAGYSEYLEEIQQNAAVMQSVSIFKNKTGYAVSNINKTAEDFSGLTDIVPSADISKGIVTATGQRGTDFILLFWVAAVCIFLVLTEKQAGLFLLTGPTVRGRGRMFLSKLLMLQLVSTVGVIVLYGENLTAAGVSYGFGDISRAVQSMGDYQACILKISVGQYLVLFLAEKILYFSAVGMIVFLICLLLQRTFHIILAVGILSGMSGALYYLPGDNSVFSTLKYVNLYYFMHTDNLLTIYRNVNIGRPVNLIPVFTLILVGVVVIFPFLCVKAAQGRRVLSMLGGRETFLCKHKHMHAGGVAYYEYLKLIKKRGIIWLLILLAAVQIFRIRNYEYITDSEDIYYKIYMDYLSGVPDEQTETYVTEENERYIGLYEEYESETDADRLNEIAQSLLPESAWEKVVAEYDRILAQSAKQGRMLSLIYDGGYRMLMGDDASRDMGNAVLFGLLMCICVSAVFSVDADNGMNQLIYTTGNGRLTTLKKKNKVSFCTMMVLFALVYGMDFLLIACKVGLLKCGAWIQSLESFSTSTVSIRLWQYLILLYLIRFVGAWTMLCLTRIVSFLCRDTFRAAIVSAILLVLSALLGLLGVNAVNYFSLVPLLNANLILNGFLNGNNIIYGIVYGMIATILIVVCEQYLRKEHEE